MVRIANDTEHFKDEHGNKYVYVGLDDCDMPTFSMMTLKAHFDMEAKHTVIKARYTSTTKVAGQFSAGGDNKWDRTCEPFITVDGKDVRMPSFVYNEKFPNGLPEETFIKMVRPAFNKEAITDDIEAVLKRSNHFVNTSTDIYLRPAGSIEDGDDCAVIRFALGNHKYITPAAKCKLELFTECGTFPDEDQYNKDLAEEQLIFRTIFRDQKERRSGRPITDADLHWDPSPAEKNTQQVEQTVGEHKHIDVDVGNAKTIQGLIATLQQKQMLK
jgi:hypothetical protein